jgi:hypothetical protein
MRFWYLMFLFSFMLYISILDVEISSCQSNPCHNGGTCTDLDNSFACHCPDGYVDTVCSKGESSMFAITFILLTILASVVSRLYPYGPHNNDSALRHHANASSPAIHLPHNVMIHGFCRRTVAHVYTHKFLDTWLVIHFVLPVFLRLSPVDTFYLDIHAFPMLLFCFPSVVLVLLLPFGLTWI